MITCPIAGCNKTLTRGDVMDDPLMADRVARAKEREAAAKEKEAAEDTTEVSCDAVCQKRKRVLSYLLVFCSFMMYSGGQACLVIE